MGRHILNILLFIAGITIITLLNILQPERKTISEMENRTLSPMPEFTIDSFFEGSFTSQFEEFWKDTFIFREEMVEISAAIKDFKGMTGEEEITIVNLVGGDDFAGQGVAVELDTQASQSTPVDPRYDVMDWEKRQELIALSEKNMSKAPVVPVPPPPNPDGQLVNSYLVVKDKAVEILRFYNSSGKFYADTLNNFASLLDDDVAFTSVIVPSHIEFIPDSKYKEMSYPQRKAIDYINGFITDDRITTLDAYSALEPHEEEYIYFRTDHHWTALGAYYVYRQFAEQNGFTPLDMAEYTYSEHPGFLGTLYSRTQAKSLRDNPDTVAVYKPDVKADYTIHTRQGVAIKEPVINLAKASWQNKYLVFVGGDEPLSIIRVKQEEPAAETVENSAASVENSDAVEVDKQDPTSVESTEVSEEAVFSGIASSQLTTYEMLEQASPVDSSGEDIESLQAVDVSESESDAGDVPEVVDNGKILILKDSYANAFIPFLQPHYKEIHIVDPRHYKGNIITYIKENEIKKVVFFNYYVVICAYTGFAKHLNRITVDPPPPVVPVDETDDTIASDNESVDDNAENPTGDEIASDESTDLDDSESGNADDTLGEEGELTDSPDSTRIEDSASGDLEINASEVEDTAHSPDSITTDSPET